MARPGLFLFIVWMSAACAGSPTTPSSGAVTHASTRGALQLELLGVGGVTQNASGAWDYTVVAQLRETGGVDVTITEIQIQALLDSATLTTDDTFPLLPLRAYSTRQTRLVFEAATHADVSAMSINATVRFIDAIGNADSVTESFSGFGAWDY